ncbi:MAG: type II secretion system F family protein [Candidatus Methanomethylicia archaeon]|nr:type II secretion system F family protein [Candidatus Methanomethylicia archaeon]
MIFPIVLFYFYPRIKASMRANGVLSELPFLSTYFSILALSNIPVYKGFERLSSQNVFPWFKLESKLFLIDYIFFSKDPLISLKNLSNQHPCKEFKDYLDSYIRSIECGGHPASFLIDYNLKLGERLSYQLKRFSNDASILGDLIITLFVFLPLGLISFLLILNPINAILLLKLYGLILSPILALLMFVFIDSNQFKFPLDFKYYKRMMLLITPISILIFILLMIFKVNFSHAFVFSLTIILLPVSIMYELNMLTCRNLEYNLPRFIRDISEHIKIGLNVENALSVVSTSSYGRDLDKIIIYINRALSFSIKSISDIFSELISKVNSWFTKTIFWLFSEAIIAGGGRAEVFSYLSKFCWDYYEFKRRITSELRIYSLIGYFSSFILIFTSSQLISFLNFFSKHNFINYNFNFMFIPSDLIPDLTSTLHLVILIISLLTGLLVGKISGGSILSGFKHSLISCYISLLSIHFSGV